MSSFDSEGPLDDLSSRSHADNDSNIRNRNNGTSSPTKRVARVVGSFDHPLLPMHPVR